MRYNFVFLILVLLSNFSHSQSTYNFRYALWLISSVRTGDTEIFSVNPQTGASLNVSNAPASEERYPAWSPDGLQFAFTSNRSDGKTYNLFLANADGSQVRQLTRLPESAVAYWPSWTADGRYIYYNEGNTGTVRRVKPAGTEDTLVAEGRDGCISPDGARMVYTKQGSKGFGVWVMDADGSNIRQIVTAENALGGVAPVWSPDGTQIAYSGQVGAASEIFLCNADGSNVRQITRLKKISSSPAFSPDGQYLTFRVTDEAYWRDPQKSARAYAEKAGDKRPVWMVGADGAGARVVESLRYQCAMDGSRADWRPTLTQRGPLKVSENRRFLVHPNGRAFFWLGDTAWELFHRLNREEATRYLQTRAAQGYTVIQAVVLAEMDGLRTPNPYGEIPLEDNDPGKPREAYFEHVDFIVDKAAELGLYIALLPTWGDKLFKDNWGTGPEIFNTENARLYGQWIGRRYRDRQNIIWILGGDRNPRHERDVEVWRSMAEGVAEGAGGHEQALMSFHPQPNGLRDGGSSKWFHDDKWLDFNMFQTGHCRENNVWERIRVAYERQPAKPVLDGETIYEDHPVCFNAQDLGTSSAYDVRKHAWLDVFAGGFGHTYGCHDIWQMYAPNRQPVNGPHHFWYDALDLPGGKQMQHLRRLIESRPMLERVPDETLVVDALGDDDRIQATRGTGYLFVYSSQGREFALNLGKISGENLKGWWYDPRNGKTKTAGAFVNRGRQTFTPPDSGYGRDWVLVLDDASKKYPEP